MIRCALALLFIGLSSSVADEENAAWNKNHELRSQLLKNYDKLALPRINDNGTAMVYCALYPRAAWINDEKETLITDSWMVLLWTDDRLKWDFKDYGNLHQVHFGDDELWKPDLAVYNNADITEIDHYGDTHFLVYSGGQVLWVPPVTMKTYCPLDLTFWPFDEHNCLIRFGSWTTTGLEIDLHVLHNMTEVSMEMYSELSSSWRVMAASQHRVVHKFKGYDVFYVEINYKTTIRRNTPSFAYFVVTPAVAFPLLLMFQFILPVDHMNRFTIGCSCTILILFELIFLKFSIPRLGGSVPLIVKYYSQCFVLSVLTVGITAILGRLAHPQNPIVAYPPPLLLKRFLTGPVATILCLRQHASKVGFSGKGAEDGEVLDSDSNSKSYSHEWLLVSKAADRIALVVLAVIFTFSLIGYVAPVK